MNTNNYNNLDNKNTKKRLFRQITDKDRLIIDSFITESLKKDYNGPKITCEFLANKLGFSKSTISRELKRGECSLLDGHGHYVTRYYSDTSRSRREKTYSRSHYKTKLKKNCYELETGIKFPVCEKTLYNYFHKRMLKGIKPYKRQEKSKKQAKAKLKWFKKVKIFQKDHLKVMIEVNLDTGKAI